MTNKTLLGKVNTQKIGEKPVVILPIKLWQVIEDKLEELEMFNSKSFRRKIAKARKEKTLYSSREARKMLAV